MDILSLLGTYKDGELDTLALYTTTGNKMYKRTSYQSPESFMEFALQHFKATIDSQFTKVLVHSARDKTIATTVVKRMQKVMKVKVKFPKKIRLDGKIKTLKLAFNEIYPNCDGIISGYPSMNNAYKLYKVYEHQNYLQKAGA